VGYPRIEVRRKQDFGGDCCSHLQGGARGLYFYMIRMAPNLRKQESSRYVSRVVTANYFRYGSLMKPLQGVVQWQPVAQNIPNF